MKLTDYNEIIEIMRTCGTRGCLKTIAKQFPQYSYNTLVSIYCQDIQKKTRKSHHKHHKPEVMEDYYQRYLKGISQACKEPVLLRLAEEVDLSQSLLARIVLERHLAHHKYEGNNPPKSIVSQLMKDTSAIEDPVLAFEVKQCILNDADYGPLVDNIKHSVGAEYEFILQEKLHNRGLAFLGEDDMRSLGYDKTPDIKLEVPIAVDGCIVNWIESKASFGDQYSHNIYLKDQFWSYQNRFGPGMVIYWFGFIDELDVHGDRGIMLKDEFPSDIITLQDTFS
ncbi:CDAN1-interacting nuclease 1-like isoform X2 [Ptychodera flava]|uniref:CDAN1-interacting nuclease 1-like isoform X2 n=1 Tax=Ptychodera flava TaxID=63121 RepID=UPI00396A2101